MNPQIITRVCFLLIILLPSCTAAPNPVNLTQVMPAATSSPAPRALPSISQTPTLPPAPTVTATNAPQICSPLQGEPLSGLNALVANPYHPPAPGSDDPHHGVDLALLLPNSQVAVGGRPVQAVLAGQVVMVTHDRFPYGNAVLIETPLDGSPSAGWLTDALPTPAPTNVPVSSLTCPASATPNFPDPARRSLYLLYAHMQQPSALSPGSIVSCGQEIGAVGSSGNALNPHLHLEARVGPSGLRMESMAHYDTSATVEEMSSYCLWRISGVFQMIDPLRLLAGNENK